MSYTYGFFDAVDLGGGNFDRVYSSAEFSHYWALLVGDGVFGQPSTSLNVLAITPVAMSIKVSPGSGWIKGHYLTVPDNMDEVMAVPVANPSLPRIDSIIMALNNTDRDMKLYLRSGNAAVSPKPVTLQRDADVWELELAQITVAAGAGNITQTAIKDMRTDPNRCGIVTGLIDQFDVSGFFTAAQASFNEWFANVQNQLGDDVAGNLLNLIQGLQESKLDVSAKASTTEATTGTDDTKYMTPLKVNQALDSKVAELWAIGDIRTSGRNLEVLTSGKYFQCNGRVFSATTYPALNQAIGGRFGYQGYRKNIHNLYTNQYNQSLGMYSEALNDDGTQLLIGYIKGDTGYMSIISLPDMALLRTYNLGDYYYPHFVFWSEGYPYALTHSNSSDQIKIFRGNIGTTTLATILTNSCSSGPTVFGSTRIGNTVYILWGGDSTGNSNSVNISIFGVTGTSVSNTIIYSIGNSGWGSYKPMFVVGDTAYFGGTLKQTKVNAISLVDISNPEVTKFINFMKSHDNQLCPQVGMPDGSMIACSNESNSYNMPNSVATLSSSLSYQEYSVEWDYHYNLQTSGSLDSSNAIPQFGLSLVDGKPLLMVAFYWNSSSAWSCAALIGTEVDGAIRVMSEADPVPEPNYLVTNYGGLDLPNGFGLTSGPFFIFLWKRPYRRNSGDIYYDGVIDGIQLQLSNPKIPESRGIVGPSTDFIRIS